MALTKEDLQKIKLPLSDSDYKKCHEAMEQSPTLLLSSVSPELDDAYDRKLAEIYDQVHPGNNLWYEEMDYISPEDRDRILRERTQS